MKKIYFIMIVLLMHQPLSFAKDVARPKSIGGDYLLEFSMGVMNEDSHEVYEAGFEIERFIDSLEHHCAVGLSFETTDLDGETKYYAGALTSLYYRHFKLFVSSGILFGEDNFKEWKTRYGFGREFFLKRYYIIIPAFTLDRVEGESHLGLNVGIAKEF